MWEHLNTGSQKGVDYKHKSDRLANIQTMDHILHDSHVYGRRTFLSVGKSLVFVASMEHSSCVRFCLKLSESLIPKYKAFLSFVIYIFC